MPVKKSGLGKGLDSLIPNKTVKEESASQQKIKLNQIGISRGKILMKMH